MRLVLTMGVENASGWLMTNRETTITTGCKVNLFLKILSRRNDGYHDLLSLFLPLPEPHDTLTITTLESGSGFKLTCSDPSLPKDDNTVAQAYHVFGRDTGYRPDIHVRLTKRIPAGAGLGGGSSDAAALLKHLAGCMGEKAPPDSLLMSMAKQIGADVPFFLNAAPAWVQGIGELLAPAQLSLAGWHLVLACPPIHVPTSWAYAAWDRSRQDAILTSPPEESTNPRFQTGRLLTNSFESVVFARYPILRQLKQALLAQGASACVMSGSGASLCALFRTLDDAQRIRDYLEQQNTPSFLLTL